MTETNPPTAPMSAESKDWHKLKAWLEMRIAELQRELETVGLLIAPTNAVRGQIAAYRALIEAVEPKTVPMPRTSISYHGNHD